MAKKNVENKGAKDMNNALNQKEAFFIKYKKAIIAGVVVLIAIVMGLIGIKSCKDSQRDEASTKIANPEMLFSNAVSSFSNQNYERALKGDTIAPNNVAPGFLQIADEYSSTPAGNLANLYAALCYAHLEKWQEAAQYIEKFDPQDDVLVSPLAFVAKGDIYSNLKQPDKAVEAYKKAANMAESATEHGPNSSVYPLAMKKAADVLRSQKKDAEALEIYKELKEKYPPEAISDALDQDRERPLREEYDKYIEYLSK